MTRNGNATNWRQKFQVAFSGLWFAIRTQSSFYVHLPCAVAVIAIGGWLRLDAISFAILVLCIAAVLTAELFNTSVEFLAKAITDTDNENIRLALDIASGGVLLVSLFSVVIGLIVCLAAIWQ